MRAGLAGTPADGGKPWPGWWILAVTVPCLLTLPVSAVIVLQTFAMAAMSCFDSCADPSYISKVETVGAVGFFF